jgi:hypothetical protein
MSIGSLILRGLFGGLRYLPTRGLLGPVPPTVFLGSTPIPTFYYGTIPINKIYLGTIEIV